jgi:hypothetical protein
MSRFRAVAEEATCVVISFERDMFLRKFGFLSSDRFASAKLVQWELLADTSTLGGFASGMGHSDRA